MLQARTKKASQPRIRTTSRVIVSGTGSALPPIEVTNEMLCRYYPISQETIENRIGILSRRSAFDFERGELIDGYHDDDLAEMAAKQALAAAHIQPSELDLIVRVTCTPEYLFFPDSACVLHGRLGAKTDCAAFTVPTGCGGLVYMIYNVAGQISGNSVRKALIVASNSVSPYIRLSPLSRLKRDALNTAFFADGASAIVMEGVEGSGRGARGVIGGYWGANPVDNPVVFPAGGSRNPTSAENIEMHYYKMDPKKVLDYAVPLMAQSFRKLQERYPFHIEDIDHFLFHQANPKIVEGVRDMLGLPLGKVPMNVQHRGNTSAASIGILMDEEIKSGRIREGQLLVLVGVGAGWQMGSLLIRL